MRYLQLGYSGLALVGLIYVAVQWLSDNRPRSEVVTCVEVIERVYEKGRSYSPTEFEQNMLDECESAMREERRSDQNYR